MTATPTLRQLVHACVGHDTPAAKGRLIARDTEPPRYRRRGFIAERNHTKVTALAMQGPHFQALPTPGFTSVNPRRQRRRST